MIQNCTSNQVDEETLTGYIIGLQQQFKEIQKLVRGVRATGLDGPVHNVKPGGYVYVKSLLSPSGKGHFW